MFTKIFLEKFIQNYKTTKFHKNHNSYKIRIFYYSGFCGFCDFVTFAEDFSFLIFYKHLYPFLLF